MSFFALIQSVTKCCLKMTHFGVNAKSEPIQSESSCQLSVSKSGPKLKAHYTVNQTYFARVCVQVCNRRMWAEFRCVDLQASSCCISSNRQMSCLFWKDHEAWLQFHTGKASVISFYPPVSLTFVTIVSPLLFNLFFKMPFREFKCVQGAFSGWIYIVFQAMWFKRCLAKCQFLVDRDGHCLKSERSYDSDGILTSPTSIVHFSSRRKYSVPSIHSGQDYRNKSKRCEKVQTSVTNISSKVLVKLSKDGIKVIWFSYKINRKKPNFKRANLQTSLGTVWKIGPKRESYIGHIKPE